ncbi:MAG: PD-(D/E)XK nuclease family protein [Kyrpidia sp.]|nr:PD-(D/E)XK nuclease family protein [Kyrpidia sp.]
MDTEKRLVPGSPFDPGEWPRDEDGVLWLVPDGSIARAVRDFLLDRSDGLGLSRVWTLEEAAGNILSAAGERWVPISGAVRQRLVGRAMAEQAGPGGEGRLDPLAWPGIRRVAAGYVRLFREAGVSPEVLRAAAERLPAREAARAHWLAGLLRHVEAVRTGREVAADEVDALERAAAVVEGRPLPELLPGVRRVIVYGFARFTGVAARLAAAVHGVASVDIFVPAPSWGGSFQTSGGQWAALERRGFRYAGRAHAAAGAAEPVSRVSVGYPDEAGQWEGVARWAAERLDRGVPGDRIAVVTERFLTPESPLVRAFSDWGVPLAEPVMRPAAEVPVIHYVLRCLELADGPWSKDAVYDLTAGLYSPDGRERRRVLARRVSCPPGRAGADTWIEATDRALREESGLSRRDREELAGARTWLWRVREQLGALPARGSLAEWSDAIQGLLRGLGVEEALRRRAKAAEAEDWPALRSDFEAYGALLSILREWRETEGWLPWPGRCSRGDMVRWLREELARRSVMFRPGQEGGVRVLSPKTAWALDPDAAAVPELNEGVWPRREADDWFPEAFYAALRARGCEVSGPRERRAEQERCLQWLIAAERTEVTLMYVKAEAVLPSRILDRLWRQGWCVDGVPEPAPDLGGLGADVPSAGGPPFAHAAAWRAWEYRTALAMGSGEGEKAGNEADGVLRAGPSPLGERWRRIAGKVMIERLREGPTFSPWEGWILGEVPRGDLQRRFSENRVYSASLFNEYGTCPFRFLVKRVWGVEAIRPRREALDPVDAGALYHRILSALFREARRAEESGDPGIWSDADRALALLAPLWEAEVQRLEADLRLNEVPEWPLQRERMRERLERWVEFDWEQRRGQGNVRPAHFEWAFGAVREEDDPGSTPAPVPVAGLLFQGRVDRIDAAPDGRFIVYDYKRTTGGQRHGKGAILKGVDVQLPVYVNTVRQVLYPEGQPLGAAYYGLERPDRRTEGLWRKGEEHGLGARVGMAEEEWEEVMARAEQYIRTYHGRMRDGYYPVAPKACLEAFCEYAHICRKNDVLLLRKGMAPEGEGDDGPAAD